LHAVQEKCLESGELAGEEVTVLPDDPDPEPAFALRRWGVQVVQCCTGTQNRDRSMLYIVFLEKKKKKVLHGGFEQLL